MNSANPTGGSQPNARATCPWVSTSTSRTVFPLCANPAARLTAVVVLPTPPFDNAIAILLIQIPPSKFTRYPMTGGADPIININPITGFTNLPNEN
jgi:hypothetical protein